MARRKRKVVRRRRRRLGKVTARKGSLRCTRCHKRTIGGVNGRRKHMRKVHGYVSGNGGRMIPGRKSKKAKGRYVSKKRLESEYYAARKNYDNAVSREMEKMGINPRHALLKSTWDAINARVRPLHERSRAAYRKLIAYGRRK